MSKRGKELHEERMFGTLPQPIETDAEITKEILHWLVFVVFVVLCIFLAIFILK